jgi:glycosyltransferase involved in cell wall biosynthesis
MRFSVVVPLHNREAFIARTAASVFAQTFADFEFIVVDDGSTDGSVERLASIDDPRLRIVRQANGGPGAARSRGMAESRGEWIAFLDADDIWFPAHLDELNAMATRFPMAGLLASSYRQGSDPAPSLAADSPGEPREIDYFREAARDIGVVWTSATAVRREVAQTIGDFDTSQIGEDLDYWARVALVAPIIKSSRVTAYYFRHDKSLMAVGDLDVEDRKLPATLGEIWPSTALLERVRLTPEQSERREAIELYQRNAVYLTMLGYAARGRIEEARQVRGLLPGKHADKAALLALALRFPAPVLRLGLRMRNMARGAG